MYAGRKEDLGVTVLMYDETSTRLRFPRPRSKPRKKKIETDSINGMTDDKKKKKKQTKCQKWSKMKKIGEVLPRFELGLPESFAWRSKSGVITTTLQNPVSKDLIMKKFLL